MAPMHSAEVQSRVPTCRKAVMCLMEKIQVKLQVKIQVKIQVLHKLHSGPSHSVLSVGSVLMN